MSALVWSTLFLLFAGLNHTAAKDSKVYELRVYIPNPKKQAEVNQLIAESGMKYMAKHQIELVGVWNPLDKKDERVLMLVAHKDKASGDKNWAAFQADEGWKADLAKSSQAGRAVAEIQRFFFQTTEFSPAVKIDTAGNRIFELRTYATTPNNLTNIHARFANHTIKLFEKHGMQNFFYFQFLDGEKTTAGQMLKGLSPLDKSDADVKPETEAKSVGLVYFLAHKDADAMKASFDKFRTDDAWKKVLADSEKNAGGPLTVKNGVKSLPLVPTAFSPWK